MYINKLDDIYILVNSKYNNTFHSTVVTKPVDLRSKIHINSSKKINDDDSKLKSSDTVRISKQENVFPKSYVLNSSEEVFVIAKIKNTAPWTYVISDLKDE